MVSTRSRVFRLGKWLVEADANRLSSGDRVQHLEPKTMAVLLYLCERPGDVVSADALIDSVWGGRPLGDNPVYKSIAKLRRALEDGPNQSQYILTVPKKGYKLIGEISEAETPDTPGGAAAGWRRYAPVAAGIVLGFVVAAAVLWRPLPLSEPTNFTPVSTFPGAHSQPSLAPDGRRFAFVNDVGGTPHIWVWDGAGETSTQLTFGSAADARPRWSPTDERILFARAGSVWSVSTTGGEPVELLRDAQNPNWSRDGSTIVFERRYGIWTADADGGNQSRLPSIAQSDLALAPRWPAFSPDGTKIVFFETDESPAGDLWTLDLDTDRLEKITDAPAFGGAPVWSPDGREIIYSSQRGGSRTLWSVDPRERTSRALLVGSGDDDFPDISADGKRIVYSNSRERFVLLRQDIETGREKVLHESRLALIGPELSPDGDTIALFGPVATGGVQLFTVPVSGGSVKMITADAAAMHALPRWAPDGQSLYFFQTSSTSSYSRVSATGGPIDIVADGWTWNVANGAAIDPSGTRILHSRLDGQAPIQTMMRQLDTATDENFFATLEYPRWSRDGRLVAGSLFTNQRFPGDIAVCVIADQECLTIAEAARIPMWSADESRIFFVRGFGETQELFVINADGSGEERKLFDMEPLSPLGPFYTVTTDDAIVWVRHEKAPGAIWVIDR